ncbi:flippase [Psychromonas sp. PT13]|uniref:flippase n=1 Tax=Psychromonas sp. PT13 TaxID=3439547 RepID=UPI003EC057C8
MVFLSKIKELKHHKGFIRYFKNTSWLFAEKILRMVVGLFVGIWVARYLGPEQFGLFSYAQSFLGLFTVFIALGLDSIVVKELLNNEGDRDVLLGTTFVLKLVGFFIMIIVILIAIQFTNHDYFTNLLILIISLSVVFQSFNVIDFYFQSRVLSKYVVMANTISLLISSILKVILILNDAPLILFASVVCIDTLVVAVGLIYFYKIQHLDFSNWKFKFYKVKYLLKQSWPMILSGVAIALYMKIDQIMIGNMLGNKAIGYYAVAVRFSEMWLFITVAITNSLFPAIINSKKTSQTIYINRIKNLYRLLVFISLVISTFIYFLSDYIVLYTYGEQYTESIALLQLYVWSIMFVFLNNGSWKWYISENLQHIATIRLFAGALINILLNLYWIEKYGLIGAVYATLISYSIATYFGNLLSSKTIINFRMQTEAIFTFYKIKEFK